ncbi:MAG: hypothetical protein ACRDRU_19380 [Pseudonocardiaceae bacterium]
MTAGMTRPSVRSASTLLLTGLALLTLALAACAQDDGGGIASAGKTNEEASSTNTNPAPAEPEDAGIAYAQCMRDNGVPDFPDPNADGSFALGHDQFDRDDPTFRAAQEACSDLAPGREHQDTGDPELVEQMREFSQCMRDNGLPDFPDPDADGRLRGLGHEARGDPKYQAALETCRDKLPGGGEHN